MSTSGSCKKLNLDPIETVKEGDDARQSDNDVIGANLKQHPLLNNVVMDTLFKQLSLLNHDDPENSPLSALAKLRGVCKTWNDEISKIVRKKTHIDVGRIVTAYPEGLGWEIQDNTSGFTYSAPMPGGIGTFENLEVAILKCADLTRTSIIQWFQVMGGSVKRLRLECPLTCYHQSRFIEKILKEWCPNLRSLTLKGACCFESLVLNSFFANQTPLQNQCSSLKEFVFYSGDIYWNQSCYLCTVKIQELETPGDEQQSSTYETRGKKLCSHSNFVCNLNNYLARAGEPNTTPAQEEKLLNKLVGQPIGLASVSGMSPATFGPHVGEFFQQQFKCDPGYETDGGLIGQLMKMSKVEKLVIRYRQVKIVKELLSMFLYRPNLWLSSVQDFEFVSNLLMATVNDLVYEVLRTTFSKLGCIVKRLKLYGGSLERSFNMSHESMLTILTSFAESLEELRIKWEGDGNDEWMELPVLPNLKLLEVECDGNTVLNPAKEDFCVKFPKLEKCVLKDEALTYVSLFEIKSFGLFSHPLKVLELLDGYVVDEDDIVRIVMCFPNLKSANLSIWGSEEAFAIFWMEMGNLSLEHLKIRTSFEILPQQVIEDNIANFQDLKSMEMVHEGRRPITLPKNFSKAFKDATKLQYLKFIKFQVRRNDVKEFKNNLANCVVEIPVAED